MQHVDTFLLWTHVCSHQNTYIYCISFLSRKSNKVKNVNHDNRNYVTTFIELNHFSSLVIKRNEAIFFYIFNFNFNGLFATED